MKIKPDTEGTITDCPIADAGIATLDQCWDCFYFVEMDGFEVVCSHEEPLQIDSIMDYPEHYIPGQPAPFCKPGE